MTRSLPLSLLAGASLLSATAALAVAPQAKPTPAATMAAQKTTRVTTTRHTTTTTAKPRMVTAKLANGKTVTYNCALPGNASKQACK